MGQGLDLLYFVPQLLQGRKELGMVRVGERLFSCHEEFYIKMLAVEEMGYPYEEVDGHIFPKGERDCDTDECAKLIEASHVWAAHHGIELEEGD